ncbi:MAG: anti-sigma factor [Terracidiphilus sp.]
MERAIKNSGNKCTGMETKLADMLLTPDSAPAKVTAHVAECDSCRAELEKLQATMNLLDTWSVPEPSPYFMTRLGARLDEERAAPPASWLARLRARFAYGPQMHIRPLAAMALTVVLLLGGGAYLDISNWDQPPAAPTQAAIVHDLQTLDNNAQLLDQLEALSNNDNSEN